MLDQGDAVAVPKSLISNDLGEALSLGSCVSACKSVPKHDVAGNEKSGALFSGGGCTSLFDAADMWNNSRKFDTCSRLQVALHPRWSLTQSQLLWPG